MASPVRHTTAPVSLTTLTKIQTLASEGSLVDFTIGSSTEWHAIVFQLHRNRTRKKVKDKNNNKQQQTTKIEKKKKKKKITSWKPIPKKHKVHKVIMLFFC